VKPGADLEATHLADLSRGPDHIDEEHGGEEPVHVGWPGPRARDELLDRADEIRLGKRPVVRALPLHEASATDVLCEKPSVLDPHEIVVAVVNHERRNVDDRKDVSDVELEDRVPPRACADRRCAEAFDPATASMWLPQS
jgi:hypothetical protein